MSGESSCEMGRIGWLGMQLATIHGVRNLRVSMAIVAAALKE
jgi:hypothetical protein